MRIEVWSDVVCPWCYIGKRRLDEALADFAHRDDVEVVFRSYELDPSAPARPTRSVLDWLADRYGGGADGARAMQEQVSAVAAADGLEYRLDGTLHLSTHDAHRLLHLALTEHGAAVQGRLKESLLAAYLTRAENVADHGVLRALAAGAGLPLDRVDAVLASEEYAAAVRADQREARALGATGVPFVVVDRRYAVSGAQPVEVFRDVVGRAWSEARSSLVAVGEGDACGPTGCG